MHFWSAAFGFVLASAIFVWQPVWASAISDALEFIVSWSVKKWKSMPRTPKE